MSKASLKAFFRTQLKVVAGGPAVGTPGANRAAGVLAALDKVVDEAVEVPVPFASLTGAPGDNQALAAALAQLSDDTLTQQHRIDAVLLALAPLQADPVTKTYVDNLVQAISHIDADQATAIQQLQQHLASDDGLLQGILSTQATHTQQLAALQALGGRFRGPWAATTAYKQYDQVRQDSATYYAKQDFTSGSTFDANNWVLLPGSNTGIAIDGGMTQKAASENFALKLDKVQAWPDMNNGIQVYPQALNNTFLNGACNYFNGDVSRDLPDGIAPYTGVGGLMYWYAYNASTITFTKGTLDGATSVKLAAGEWRIVSGAGGFATLEAIWTTKLNGNLLTTPNPGGGAYTAGTGIDLTGTVISTKASQRIAFTATNSRPDSNALFLPVPHAQFTKLSHFDLVEFNDNAKPGCGWDAANQRYVVSNTARHRVSAGLECSPGQTLPNGQFYLIIYVNGVWRCNLFIQNSTQAGVYSGLTGQRLLALAASDYVEAYTWHDTGDGTTLVLSKLRTYFALEQTSD